MIAWLKRLFGTEATPCGYSGSPSTRIISLTVSAADEIRVDGKRHSLAQLRDELRRHVGKDVVVSYEREHPERPASPLVSEVAQSIQTAGLAIAFPPEARTTVDIVNCWVRFRESVLGNQGEVLRQHCTVELATALEAHKGGPILELCRSPMPVDSLSMTNNEQHASLHGKIETQNQSRDANCLADIEVRFRNTPNGWRVARIVSADFGVQLPTT